MYSSVHFDSQYLTTLFPLLFRKKNHRLKYFTAGKNAKKL